MPDTFPGQLPRVAMLVAGDVYGGAERQLITLCRAGLGEFDATILTTLAGPVPAAAASAGIAHQDLAGAGVRGAARNLRAALANGTFDLIHSHGYRASFIAALAQWTGRTAAVVRTVHGAPESMQAPKMALYEQLGRLADRWTRATVVYVSDELANRMGRPAGSLVIHNGVEPPAPKGPRPVEFTADRAHIVAVGRLEPVKDLGSLITALSRPELRSRARLHLIGDGPLRAELHAQAQTLGLGTDVIFHGFRRDALQLIGHADALALPSLHEGIPYVLLEALALGTPLVATRVGGIPEVVHDGREGLLVRPQAPGELAAALCRVLQDKVLADSMRTAGIARVREEFSASIMAERYAQLYRDVLTP